MSIIAPSRIRRIAQFGTVSCAQPRSLIRDISKVDRVCYRKERTRHLPPPKVSIHGDRIEKYERNKVRHHMQQACCAHVRIPRSRAAHPAACSQRTSPCTHSCRCEPWRWGYGTRRQRVASRARSCRRQSGPRTGRSLQITHYITDLRPLFWFRACGSSVRVQASAAHTNRICHSCYSLGLANNLGCKQERREK